MPSASRTEGARDLRRFLDIDVRDAFLSGHSDTEGMTQAQSKVFCRRVRKVVLGAMALMLALAGIRILFAYYTGTSAADAVLEELGGVHGLHALEAEVYEDLGIEPGDSFDTPQGRKARQEEAKRRREEKKALRARAGQGQDEQEPQQDGWWSRDFGESALSTMAFEETNVVEHEPGSLDYLSTESKKTDSEKAGDHRKERWGDTWMRLELNQAMEGQRKKMNQEIPQQVMAMMSQATLPKGALLTVDYLDGPQTLQIDHFETRDINSNYKKGEAVSYMRVKAHAGTLSTAGKFRLARYYGWHGFKIAVHDAWAEAPRVRAVVDYDNRLIKKGYVGRVNAHAGKLEGTCYCKKNPAAKDHLCTSFMLKQLNYRKKALQGKMGQKLAASLQDKLDERMPINMRMI